MRNCALLIVLALGPSLIPATAQVSNVDAPSSNKNLADRIQKGDSVAILEAGKTGDSSFIPQLLAYRRKSGKRKDFQVIAVQLALAKLGQQPELQQVRCELLFGSPSVQYDAVGKLEYLGGWFSIEAVMHVLDNPEYRGGYDGAGLFASPGSYASRKLSTIVPNPPAIESGISLPSSAVDLGRQRQWKEWIESHQGSLSKIPPIGSGVETSPKVCKNVLKHDRSFDHEAIKPLKIKGKKGEVIGIE
jgi:hypothetical protein